MTIPFAFFSASANIFFSVARACLSMTCRAFSYFSGGCAELGASGVVCVEHGVARVPCRSRWQYFASDVGSDAGSEAGDNNDDVPLAASRSRAWLGLMNHRGSLRKVQSSFLIAFP